MKAIATKIFLIAVFSFISILAFSQLNIVQNNNAQALVQKLLGTGVTVSNVTLNGSSLATGFFNNISGTNIGLDSGIVLTNGRAKTVSASLTGMDGDRFTPAYTTLSSSGAFASNNLNFPGDADLTSLLGGQSTFDATILQFDFVPLGDTVRFRYVFSSEEYPEFPCSGVNDAFAFFIQGPGFPVKKNIALVPGTNNPVTIDNINDVLGCGPYPQFYLSNKTNTLFTHNGHTTIFTAVARVQPCQTYTLKLVIADVGDHIYDSGVFLEAGSLTSNSIAMTNLTQTDPGGNSYLVEGCATGAFEVRRPRKDPSPLIVSLSYGGTATNGIDVQTLPPSVTIPANDSLVVVNVIPLIDGVLEGTETLVVYALAGCAAGLPTDSTVIQIRDYDTLTLIPRIANICKNASVQLLASAGYSFYQWQADPTLSSTGIRNPVATPVTNSNTYICTATEGTCNGQDSVLVKWKEIDFISKQDVNCRGGATGNIKVAGGSEWQQPVEFSIDGINWQPDSNFYSLPVGNYWVKMRDAFCLDSINVTINQAFPDLLISNTVTSPAGCAGNPDGLIDITASGGSNPYVYSIDGINFQAASSFNVAANNYTFTVKDNNGCTATQNVVIPLNDTIMVDAGIDDIICEGKSYTLPALSNAATYNWTPASSLNDANTLNPVASPVTTTLYYLQATTGICSHIDSIKITVRPAPVANAGPDIAICYGKNVQLNGSGGVSYQWSPSTYFITASNIANPESKPTRDITYYLMVKDIFGCESLSSDDVFVDLTPAVKIFAGRDTVAAINQPIQLHAVELSNAGVTQYSWDTPTFLNNAGIASPIATLPYDYRYIVTGKTSDGCEGSDDIIIKVYKGPEIYVPSGFTPNNDGLNDLLKAIPVGIKDFHFFRIFNRWGQIIFSTQDPTHGWNGRVNGIEQPTGTYIWIAEAIDYKGNLVTRKGVVTIIR